EPRPNPSTNHSVLAVLRYNVGIPPDCPTATALLQAWGRGERKALDDLMPLVYRELRRLAHRQMRHERADHTLETTALVHEAFVRLIDGASVDWRDRSHFFAAAARLMRRILVDRARAKRYLKRRGGQKVSLHDALVVTEPLPIDLLDLNDALDRLAK